RDIRRLRFAQPSGVRVWVESQTPDGRRSPDVFGFSVNYAPFVVSKMLGCSGHPETSLRSAIRSPGLG
ncbi:MAG: hypothetical protein ACT6FF_08260, partial [Methanosarcinaceae archaeon]